MRVFFATDIHGSEVCWRKFLNAGKFHKADVLIMGGDMTGKAMVPIVGQRLELGAGAPGPAPRPDDGGRAPGDGEADQRPRLLPGPADPRRGRRVGGGRDARRCPVQGGDARQRRALDGARRRAASGHRASAASCRRPTTTSSRSTRSSTRAEHLELGEGNTIALDGFTLVSTGWANPTPWNTFRELPEPELRERIDGLVAQVPDPHRAIFNFHAPPYGSNLDNAPEARRRHELRVGRPGAHPGRIAGGPRVDPRLRPAAVAARPHPRGQGRGQARLHAGGQPGQLVRGRRAPGGHRRPRSRRRER